MTAPSLLRTGKTQTIPSSVFDDLQLRRLLTEKTVYILSHPTSVPSDIRAQQEVFAYLLSEKGAAHTKESYLALKEYERIHKLWKGSPMEAEKVYLYCTLLREYCRVGTYLSEFKGGGEITDAMSAYWAGQAETRAALTAALDAAEELLRASGSVNMSFAERQYMTGNPAPVTYMERLVAAADALGLPLDDRKAAKIRLNDATSHALLELYEETFARVSELLAPFEGLDLQAPSAYIAELDYFNSILNLVEKAQAIDIPYCFPKIADTVRYRADGVYDISLFIKDAKRIVPNETFFTEEEPFFFLTGANGGGKTTYLRAVTINLILFLSGCPVFARSAEMYPFTAVLSHFPADERFSSAVSRLDEEQLRVGEMLKEANDKTFLVFNETFSGTDDIKGCELTLDTAEKIRTSGAFGLFVTHFHEVRKGGHPMLNTIVDADNENNRTFRIVRDLGLTSSFANDILRKYRLDAVSLKERGE